MNLVWNKIIYLVVLIKISLTRNKSKNDFNTFLSESKPKKTFPVTTAPSNVHLALFFFLSKLYLTLKEIKKVSKTNQIFRTDQINLAEKNVFQRNVLLHSNCDKIRFAESFKRKK